MEVCRICLATDRRMFAFDTDHKQLYTNVTGLTVPPIDRLPKHICWECRHCMSKYFAFKSKAATSRCILEILSIQNIALTTSVLKKYQQKPNLLCNDISYLYLDGINHDDLEETVEKDNNNMEYINKTDHIWEVETANTNYDNAEIDVNSEVNDVSVDINLKEKNLETIENFSDIGIPQVSVKKDNDNETEEKLAINNNMEYINETDHIWEVETANTNYGNAEIDVNSKVNDVSVGISLKEKNLETIENFSDIGIPEVSVKKDNDNETKEKLAINDNMVYINETDHIWEVETANSNYGNAEIDYNSKVDINLKEKNLETIENFSDIGIPEVSVKKDNDNEIEEVVAINDKDDNMEYINETDYNWEVETVNTKYGNTEIDVNSKESSVTVGIDLQEENIETIENVSDIGIPEVSVKKDNDDEIKEVVAINDKDDNMEYINETDHIWEVETDNTNYGNAEIDVKSEIDYVTVIININSEKNLETIENVSDANISEESVKKDTDNEIKKETVEILYSVEVLDRLPEGNTDDDSVSCVANTSDEINTSSKPINETSKLKKMELYKRLVTGTILNKEHQIAEMKEGDETDNYLIPPFKCSNCFKRFSFIDTFNRHMELHSESAVQCPNPETTSVSRCDSTHQIPANVHMLYHVVDGKLNDKQELWSEDDLKAAVGAVQKNGLSQSVAASKYKIPRTILRNYLLTGITSKLLLTNREEQGLCQSIRRLADIGLTLTPEIIRRQAFLFCERFHVRHKFDRKKQKASHEWVRFFLKRNPSIKELMIKKKTGPVPKLRSLSKKSLAIDRLIDTSKRDNST